jgi:hypothetical protein
MLSQIADLRRVRRSHSVPAQMWAGGKGGSPVSPGADVGGGSPVGPVKDVRGDGFRSASDGPHAAPEWAHPGWRL